MPKTEDKDLKYAWIDLETTGSDERTDCIIEFGIVLTDADLNEIEAASWVIYDDGALQDAPEVVREMHAANGLADEVASGMALVSCEHAVIDVLSRHGKEHDFVMAGSGVAHFDRRFIAYNMDHLIKWFRYYSIDVGVMRRVLRMIGRDDLLLEGSGNKTHRALDDALLHLEELRHIKKALAP